MGPKNEAVMCEYAPAKELSWIDRMYQKLESVCVEVDNNPSLLFQETTKYVENHMNVVGTNMRKLCAELIQDLLPPSAISSDGAVKKADNSVQCHCEILISGKSQQKTVEFAPELSVDADSGIEAPKLTQENGSTVAKEHGCSFKTLAEQEERNEREDGDFAKRVESAFGERPACDSDRAEEQAVVGENIHDHRLEVNITAADLSCCSKDKDHLEIHKVTVEQAEEDQEQWAHWYVSEEDRRLSPSTCLNCCDKYLQVEGCQEEIEAGWELI